MSTSPVTTETVQTVKQEGMGHICAAPWDHRWVSIEDGRLPVLAYLYAWLRDGSKPNPDDPLKDEEVLPFLMHDDDKRREKERRDKQHVDKRDEVLCSDRFGTPTRPAKQILGILRSWREKIQEKRDQANRQAVHSTFNAVFDQNKNKQRGPAPKHRSHRHITRPERNPNAPKRYGDEGRPSSAEPKPAKPGRNRQKGQQQGGKHRNGGRNH